MSNHLAYIEDFCENRLSKEENAQANQRIQSDPSFAKDVAFYLQMRHLSEMERKERLKSLYYSLKQKQKGRMIRLVSVAAAAVVIILTGILFINQTPTPEEYARLYIKDNLSTLPTTMSDQNDVLSQGVNCYNEGAFEKALALFKQLTSNTQALEYQGLCHLQLKQYPQALSVFGRIAQNKELLENKGKFYEAITLLQMGQKEKAKTIFIEITESNEDIFGKQEAEELLKNW
ncbi:MAG: tetratricopeptide repeat protein [Flectobacillus sp.]|uniref:tetratricopeptide repeat protein n=1 Tax=Flectobacillus sp. TaxID=50419 RepID=UPI003B9CCDC1